MLEYSLWNVLIVALAALVVMSIIRYLISWIKISKLTQRNVFITGCDSGFGNLLARLLDANGVQVIAACLTNKGATDLKDATSSRLKTVLLDITNKEDVHKAFQYVVKCLGTQELWGLVNNAGVMPSFGPAEMTTIEVFENVFKVNLLGSIHVTLTFLPLLRKSRGRIVNVCSVTSNVAYPGVTNYVVSKAALKMFTSCLRRELYSTGVTAHTIEPGGFDTNLTKQPALMNMIKKMYTKSSPELQSYYGGNIANYLIGGIKLTSAYVSSKPQYVAEAMMHALLARFPKSSYLVGLDAHLFFRIMMILPDWIGDYILGWPQPYGNMCQELE